MRSEQEMFRRRLRVQLFGMHAWVATPEDVLLHKLYWNHLTPSERQLLDAAGVFAVQAGDLDLDYLKLWAPKLGVSAELDDLISGKLRPKTTGTHRKNVVQRNETASQTASFIPA